MGKRRRRYETEFVACLLVVGPIPYPLEETSHFQDDVWRARKTYQFEVMDWWVNWHGHVSDKPTTKSQFKFYRKFRAWQRVNMKEHSYESNFCT